MVEHLSGEVPGDQGLERPCGSVNQEVQIANFLLDNAQFLAGEKVLYLRTEALTQGPCPVSQRGPICDCCAAGSAGGSRGCVRPEPGPGQSERLQELV